MPFEDNFFDIIIIINIFDYTQLPELLGKKGDIFNPKIFAENVYSKIKNKGVVFIVDSSYKNYDKHFKDIGFIEYHYAGSTYLLYKPDK